MILTRPVVMVDSLLVSSNVTETDQTEWVNGTRVIGDLRMVTTTANGASVATHKIYKANTTTGADPTLVANQGLDSDGAGNGWNIISATNRWKLFSNVLQEQTVFADLIDVSITPGQSVNSITLMNLDAASVDIEMTDPVDGVVYSNTVNLTSYSGISDWYAQFYEPIIRETYVVDNELPAFPACTLNIDINNSGADSKCGELVTGQLWGLGDSQYGASFGIIDYSQKVTAADGAVTITPGPHKTIADVQVNVETARFSEIMTVLTGFKSTPAVFYIDSLPPIFGYYRSFNVTISGPVRSDTLLSIEGLT
jgi:hypothetical protein